ncbi:DUF1385 domain-containing protein [Brevibacillus halotolerans]|uniref:DUF1385 domain-containing protein n=1 Tax=Brevibacillus halotolerans TaxID=1507437 RepID=UPI0015EEB06E|nr:DUF1385 domain-containing protein [Brevibacillus halotolerans]MBA4533415.1 DUF1385 domain-containing protein [Brevibacillus halotolerans]
MIAGISFGNGVFYHNKNVIACAEVKNGVIHTWAEKMGMRTLCKMWWRIVSSLPWYYHILHLLMLLYVFFPVLGEFDPLWLVVYGAGFHFIFPKRLKQFHGAEHKVFSYYGEVKPENWEKIQQASIINRGCSTNMVTFFFVFFLPTICFFQLWIAIVIGLVGIGICNLLSKYALRLIEPLYRVSGFLQYYLTTKEPERIHMDTAIRSYALFIYFRNREEANDSL